MRFSFALKQLACFFLATCLIPVIVLMPFVFGIDPSSGIIAYMMILILASVLADISTRNVGRGVWTFVTGLFFVVLLGVWISLSVVLAVVTGVDREEMFGVLGFGWIFLYLVLRVGFWLVEREEEDEDVVVQRGRERDNSPLYLFVSDEHREETEEPSIAITPEEDAEAYARYQAWGQPIPDEEFDETFVYDSRQPYRLPFTQDSKYRALFERRAK